MSQFAGDGPEAAEEEKVELQADPVLPDLRRRCTDKKFQKAWSAFND